MSFLCDMGERIYTEYMTNPAVMRYSHVHPQYELYFCPHGIPQSLVINGREMICHEPCVILSAPYTIHAMSPLENRIFERIVVYFGERTLSAVSERLLPKDFLQRSMGCLFRLDEASASRLRRTLNVLLESETPTEEEAELTLLLFLHKLFAHCEPQAIHTLDSADYYIRSVLRHVVENVAEHEDSTRIASRFAVSRSKLDRDFKRATGCTLQEFSEACRLHHAKTMLLNPHTHYSMEQIAAACGFLSETYFFSFFKKHTAMTPTQFRKASMPANGIRAVTGGCQ